VYVCVCEGEGVCVCECVCMCVYVWVASCMLVMEEVVVEHVELLWEIFVNHE
jgi:hypothetical protein